MNFYQALQMDPSILKRKIAASDTRREKMYYWLAIAVRSVLIVAFCDCIDQLVIGNLWGGKYADGCGAVLYFAGNSFCEF